MRYSENRGIRGRFSSTAQQRLNESHYAAYLQDINTRATFSENFSSIRSVLSSPNICSMEGLYGMSNSVVVSCANAA